MLKNGILQDTIDPRPQQPPSIAKSSHAFLVGGNYYVYKFALYQFYVLKTDVWNVVHLAHVFEFGNELLCKD